MKLIIAQPYISLKGGADRVILEIARHYKAKIITTQYDRASAFSEFKDLDIEIVGKKFPFSNSLPYRAAQGLNYGYNFYTLKIKEDYDLINAHISPSEWVRNKNERLLWYCHTPIREVYDLYSVRMKGRSRKDKLVYTTFAHSYKFFSNKVIPKIEEIATNSQTTRKRIKQYLSRDAKVINPGIDAKMFSNKGDEKFFFFPARFTINKRQDYAVEAYKRLVKSCKEAEKYRLVLAGTLSENPEHLKYFESIKKLSKGHNIQLRTDVSEKQLLDLYSRCTCVISAAINEDFGLTPLEAMASSKPIIAVNEGGHRETVENEKNGFLVNSTSEMASAMKFIVEHPSIAKKMGKDGRRIVESKYSWSNFFSKFDPLVRKVARDK